jgi:hypothetical protein
VERDSRRLSLGRRKRKGDRVLRARITDLQKGFTIKAEPRVPIEASRAVPANSAVKRYRKTIPPSKVKKRQGAREALAVIQEAKAALESVGKAHCSSQRSLAANAAGLPRSEALQERHEPHPTHKEARHAQENEHTHNKPHLTGCAGPCFFSW